jgi:nucleotide-binding universal stress UspA family protein
MSAYRTVVVGTDGSDPSPHAVARAGAPAAAGARDGHTVAVAGSPVDATCRSDVDELVVHTTD